MADRSPITNTRVIEALAPSDENRIAILFAYRTGLVAVCDELSKIAEAQAISRDDVAEVAFSRALDALTDINRRIMAAPAISVADLAMQAEVARADEWGGDLPPFVATALANIAVISARAA